MTFDPQQTVGQAILDVDTPVALLDLDIFEANARSIAGFLAENGMQWRPHSKAHKSPRLARLQIEIGAIGVTCAKVGEAEVMVAAGINSVLVANHLATSDKWARVAALQPAAEVIVAVDHPRHVDLAGEAGRAAGLQLPLVIEVDLGMDRVGTRQPAQSAALAELIASTDGVTLKGVMGYEGHILTAWPEEEKIAQSNEALGRLVEHANAIRAAGYEVEILSSGGSGSYRQTAHIEGLTESQAGGGCLMCRFYAEDCHVDLGHALSLVATVVSRREPDLAFTDAGFKALGNVKSMGTPRMVGRDDVECFAASAEHGKLVVAEGGELFDIGDRVHLIPAYSDAMLVNHDFMLGHRNGVVTEVIDMPGRGKLV